MVDIFAPAKINLFLHVVGKDEKNYHLLESLVAFANYSDVISVSPSDTYQFTIDGPFKKSLSAENNLVMKAKDALAALTQTDLNCHITLTKNIPIGAGLGGGSADAAATVKALIQFFDLRINKDDLDDMLLSLGADVPMCFESKTAFIQGVGEQITILDISKPIYAVLVYPNIHCDTKEIFARYDAKFSTPIEFKNQQFEFLINHRKNDLTNSAIAAHPEIQSVLNTLNIAPNHTSLGMSGSGSTCFATFKNEQDSKKAAEEIAKNNPNWWVKGVILNA